MTRVWSILCLLVLAGSQFPAVRADDPKTDKKTAQVAHIKIGGNLEESPISADPLFSLASENFKSKIDRIRKAKNDKDVAALYLHIDPMSIGWAKVEELRAAIADFRKSGKKTYAFLEEGDSHQYLLASECDLVCLPEPGWLMVTGLQVEVTFFKELLEKLGIKADFLQMGVYKFAAEPFTRSKMSPEARAQYKLVLDDFYDRCLVGGISSSRMKNGRKNLTTDRVTKIIDEGPFSAKRALELGLIDRIAYAEEIENIIKMDQGVEKVKILKNYGGSKADEIDFTNPFAIFKLLAPPKSAFRAGKDRIALVYAVGPIVTGKGGASLFGGDVVGSTTVVEAIKKAEDDPKVKAIVLRVDSPGGSALASDLIWKALKDCKKPVIASMSDVAASGGYYISMGARKVYAEPGTLTGSIGVVGGKLALGGLFDKVGITTDSISRGTNAGLLSTTHPFSTTQRKAMEGLMKDIYDQFLTKVQSNREAAGKKMTREHLLTLAEGRIWTGRQAHANGLVDALGTLEDAIADAKVQGGLSADTDVDYLILPKPRSFLDTLLEKGDTSLSLGVLQGLLQNRHLPELRQHLQHVDALLQLRSEPVWLMMPHGVTVR